jgi:hypothetical protein
MKKIKDPFSYSVGHGAIGISCDHLCKYFKYNILTKERFCLRHHVKLNNVFIGDDGFREGEFFCTDYENCINNISKGAHKLGLEEFNSIKDELEENILYEACGKEYLCMTPFDEIEKINEDDSQDIK